MEFLVKQGCNYLVSSKPFEPVRMSYAGMQPGDKIIQMGTVKRTSFSMKQGHYITYEGVVMDEKTQYAVFSLEWMLQKKHDNKYWLIAFVIVDAVTLLEFADGKSGCRDIRIDAVKYFDK